MNILLWVLQVVLAWFSAAGGIFQIFKIEDLQKNVASMRELPYALWAVLGAIGIVAGVGLILPRAANMMPVLTPISAAIICAESILISGFYIYFGDTAPLPYTVVMS